MIRQDNILKADEGKYLLYQDTPRKSICIGSLYIFDGTRVNLVTISEDEITEVYPVVIYDNVYYVTSENYSDLVTELIRKKYSLDDELALIANSRIGKLNGESEFQAWRKICKETAKKVFNE